MLCALAGAVPDRVQGQSSGQISIDADAASARIVDRTNEYRRAGGQQALAVDAALQSAAQAYAAFLAGSNASGHHADGGDWESRARAAGYQPCWVAENVYDYWSEPGPTPELTVADHAFDWWRQSPGHDANMRDPRNKEIGVGVAAWRHGGRNIYRLVQLFGDDCQAGPPTPEASSTGAVMRPSELIQRKILMRPRQ